MIEAAGQSPMDRSGRREAACLAVFRSTAGMRLPAGLNPGPDIQSEAPPIRAGPPESADASTSPVEQPSSRHDRLTLAP